MKIFRKTLCILSVVAAALCSCERSADTIPVSGEQGGDASGRTARMTFGLSAADMRTSALGAAEGRSTVDEDALKNLWVLQFDGATDASKLLFCEYYDASMIGGDATNGYSLSVALYETSGDTKIYFVANVGPNRFQKFLPVFSQPRQRVFHGHPVDSRRSPVGSHPLVSVVQVSPAQNRLKQSCTVPFADLPSPSTLRSRILFVFRTIPLRAACLLTVFCVLHTGLLPSFTKDLRLFSPSRFFPPGTMASADFLQFVVTVHFFSNTPTQMHLQDLPGYSHVLSLFYLPHLPQAIRAVIGL